ncbi:putative glutathione S-transferase [Pseudovirgaria hyperparasitica]|uniref:Putative glutathione S-transferase n=1 Tax=Pseudovirgaria hyperparasitica TaxID=470096 RepID=A0A6A6WMK4_9PEZI|nr:putative glutathione S-transferase [Pseudovirgaria hyperparasitica]KAF2763382.1 putative glutathione S-transferase [Pseudovirgaria hyperparasitica]
MAKNLILYNAEGGPNPFKVMIILEELGVPYEESFVPYSELKKEKYESINPNGRVPSLVDPNTGLTIWESGAICEYLLETYDKDFKISHPESPEKWAEKQWLFYQVSGQGPYWGQAAWFNIYHPEKIRSVQDRYMNETKRIIAVIDKHLASRPEGSTSHPVLVGDKVTYADLFFVMWHNSLPYIFMGFPDEFNEDDYPAHKKWLAGLKERDSVKKACKAQMEAITAAQAKAKAKTDAE